MKESGINYFYGQLGLPTGQFAVFYTFEDGAGTNVASVSGGQTGYSGTLSSVGAFWSSPGSGFFTGQTLSVNNASGIHSETWTRIFSYQKVNTDDCVLFSSLGGGSGCRIGLTKANKLFFEGFNVEPILAASSNNLSSKNVVSVSYLTNLVTLGYFNFNSQLLEAETFNLPFQVTQSDNWRLGGAFTGYMDYHIHLTEYQSPEVIGQLISGLYARPTGYGYEITTVCSTGITGYQDVFVGQTGVTGYQTLPFGDEGVGFYTGAFPLSHSISVLTGYLSTGLYSSGVSGVSCTLITGAPVTLLEYQYGYAASFGMEKVQLYTAIPVSGLVKSSWSLAPFDDTYNKAGQRSYSGYLMAAEYPTGLLNLFYNGVAQAASGWSVTGTYLIVSGTTDGDSATYDLKSGNKVSFQVGGGQTGFAFAYSGQEIYLNGINLISGYDFVLTAGTLNLLSRNAGIDGNIFEYPIVLSARTGQTTLVTGGPFWRNTSNEYLNGVRQINYSTYIEGALFDLLSGTAFYPKLARPIYENTDLYWET